MHLVPKIGTGIRIGITTDGTAIGITTDVTAIGTTTGEIKIATTGEIKIAITIAGMIVTAGAEATSPRGCVWCR